jgi:hypothetical protein
VRSIPYSHPAGIEHVVTRRHDHCPGMDFPVHLLGIKSIALGEQTWNSGYGR